MSYTLLQGKDKQFRRHEDYEKSITLTGTSLKPGLNQVSLRIRLIPTPFPDNQTVETGTWYGHGDEVHYILESLPEGVLQASVNYDQVPESIMAPMAASEAEDNDAYLQPPVFDVNQWRGA
jgi:hypothetical protein